MARIDVNSQTWEAVKTWASSDLEKSRNQLESEVATADQTIALRARIKLLKRLLELPNQIAPLVETGVAFGIDAPVS